MAEAAKKLQPKATDSNSNGGDSLSFLAEIKQVSAKKTASLDLEYRVVFSSDDPVVNSLGLVSADQLVRVTVRGEDA